MFATSKCKKQNGPLLVAYGPLERKRLDVDDQRTRGSPRRSSRVVADRNVMGGNIAWVCSLMQALLVGLVGRGGDHADRLALHEPPHIDGVARGAVDDEQTEQHERRVQRDE